MEIYTRIHKAIQDIVGDDIIFSLDITSDKHHGDFATNAFFARAKKEGISPRECGEKYALTIHEKIKDIVDRIECAPQGFVNFFLSKKVIYEENKKENSDIHTEYTDKKILIEHTSPNLFKPFHIGHLMNNIVGESVGRLLSLSSSSVMALCFPSDISFGIAKALYVLQKDGGIEQDIFTEKEEEIVTYLGDCYVRGIALYKEHAELERDIRALSFELYTAVDDKEAQKSDVYMLWKKVREINTHYFSSVLLSIGSKLGAPIFESEVSSRGLVLVQENTPHVFTESEGVIVYIPDEERKDINTAVFINSEGHPTYEAKDIGLIEKKFTEYGDIDYSFTVTDNEQMPHFNVTFVAAEKINSTWKKRIEKSHHIPHGRMLFKGQKLSSRLGGVPLALDIIASIEEEVRERAGEKIAHLSDTEKEKITREIALSALRISVLRSKPGLAINFDPETSLSFEGDSGPYLLYTYARCFSLLEKGKKKGYKATFHDGFDISFLEREMAVYDVVLQDVVATLSPQKLVSYIFKIAQGCNSLYAQTQIISQHKEESEYHMATIQRVMYILKKSLYVLGIEVLDRM